MFTWVLILIYLQRKMRTAGEECPEKINDIVQKLGLMLPMFWQV